MTRQPRSNPYWERVWRAPVSSPTRSAGAHRCGYFILAEAEATQKSQRLGELGSHIVDEFLLGSLRCDRGSVLYTKPADLKGWGPSEAVAQNRRYSMPDLIGYLQANAKFGGQPIRLYDR